MKSDKKQKAREAFMSNENLTQKALAEAVGVNEKTLRGWIKAGDWDNERALKQVTRKQLLQQAFVQLANLNLAIAERGGTPDREQAMAMNSITKALQVLGAADKMQTITVFEDFLQWILKNEPKNFNVFDTLSQRYIEHLKSN